MSLGHIPSFLASQSHVSFQSETQECKSAAAGTAARKEVVWPEQAVWALLDVYEDKWRQLEWGNLKSKHWEDVSASLSAYGSFKTPVQCKNKIEDMKKKYKEKHARGVSSCNKWPYFARMDAMFRNLAKATDAPGLLKTSSIAAGTGSELLCLGHRAAGGAFDEEVDGEELYEDEEEEEESEDEQEGFCGYQQAGKRKAGGCGGARKQRRCGGVAAEFVSAVRALSELIVRIESSKLEGHRQLMLMRAQAENRRMEMEMKTTEMVMNAQLQLAKMIAEHTKNAREAAECE